MLIYVGVVCIYCALYQLFLMLINGGLGVFYIV